MASIEKPNRTDGSSARAVPRICGIHDGSCKAEGLGARFVIGYIQMADVQHDSIHAQTEIHPGRRLAPVLETRVYES